MAIEKHTTKAFILDSYESGENDIKLKLYTKDFGVLYATSIGMRKSVKLRQHLIKGRVSDITLVKGKEIYRVVGAKESRDESGISTKYIIGIINRFIHGEIKNNRLFERLIEYGNIINIEPHTLRLAVTLEVLIVLGYIDTNNINLSIENYLKQDTKDIILYITLNKNDAVNIVKKAIEISML